MRNLLTRYFISILFLLSLAISLWKFPLVMPLLGVFFVGFSLVISISSIIQKHKQGGSPRLKIVTEILVLILTLLLAVFLGGLAGMYANQYISPHFGVMAGILSALAASFLAGYLVRKGMMRIAG